MTAARVETGRPLATASSARSISSRSGRGRESGEPGVAAFSYLGEHLDLYAEDQAGEVERLIGLGATEVQWDKKPADADYVILADPEGNRFYVIDTTR